MKAFFSRDTLLNCCLAIGSLLVSLLIAEVGLHYLTPFPITEHSNKVFHPELGYIVSNQHFNIDENGFRNPEAKKNTTFIGIGDSHTYGRNVPWNLAWPYQLNNMTGQTAYSMAVPSYGIYQYHLLFERSMALKPDSIIVGFYPANDISPANCLMFTLASGRKMAENLSLSTEVCTRRNQQTQSFNHFQRRYDRQQQSPVKTTPLNFNALRSALNHLVIKPFTGTLFSPNNVFKVRVNDQPFFIPKKLLTNQARKTNLALETIQENYRNSLRIFKHMNQIARDRNIQFGVVFIPSKVRVFEKLVQKHHSGQLPDQLKPFINHEVRLVKQYKKFFQKNSIRYEDAVDQITRAVEDAKKRGGRIYPPAGGHPNENGYEAYARAAKNLLKKSD